MFCIKCGKVLEEGAKFCTGCGSPVETDLFVPPIDPKPKKGRVIIILLAILLALILALAVWYFMDPVSAHELLPVLPCPHDWQDATCSEPETCSICGETQGKALRHDWTEATCDAPQTCRLCGETKGDALGHSWQGGSCTEAKVCGVCGLRIEAPGHDWIPATCTEAKTCTVCGETEGEALGHDWIPATKEAPETCSLCGETRGDPLPESVWLTDLPITDKYGKFYFHSYDLPSFSNYNNDYHDTNTNGYIGYATDSSRNDYSNGLHLDGPDLGPYYVEYEIGGIYSTLTGVVAPAYECIASKGAAGYKKYVEILCDGVVVYKSPTMSSNSLPQTFSIDVRGVDVVRIRYATTTGSNDLATVFNAKLT